MPPSLMRMRLAELRDAAELQGEAGGSPRHDLPASLLELVQPTDGKWAGEVNGRRVSSRDTPTPQALDSVNSFLGSCKRCSGSTERTLVLDEVLQQKAGARSPAHCHDIYIPTEPPQSPAALTPSRLVPNAVLRALRMQAVEGSECGSPSACLRKSSVRTGSAKASHRIAQRFAALRKQQEKWAPPELMEAYRFPDVRDSSCVCSMNPLRLLMLLRRSTPADSDPDPSND
eukprot:EG_transcript_8800